MIAFVFPGQGSQAVGMGRAFYETSGAAKRVFEEASDTLGADFTRLIFEGPEADLALTANTQPAVLTASVAAAAACAERGVTPGLVAGHSLGEYSALVVAGALRLADALRVVRRRGELMQEAVPVGTGAMAALMGVKPDVVEGICHDAAQGEVVGIANLNSEMQIVIAGHRTAVERAVALAKERGGRKSVLLPVSAPFHCALMAPAGERLAPDLAALKIADPSIPVVRNVDAGVTRAAAAVVPFLLRQIASPVQWTACVERLAAEGADTFVEVGPGRVLTGLVKRIVTDARAVSVEDPDGLDRALEALAKA
jgi:[acyl-carrier-protein] S-malonyltransferase